MKNVLMIWNKGNALKNLSKITQDIIESSGFGKLVQGNETEQNRPGALGIKEKSYAKQFSS